MLLDRSEAALAEPAVPFGAARIRGDAPGSSDDLRRRLGLAALAPANSDLSPEIGFLAAQGVAPTLLRRASDLAERDAVSGEDALFALGFSDTRYYRLLAQHLDVHFLERPVPLSRDGLDIASASGAGWARPVPGCCRYHAVLAPRGDALRLLLDGVGFSQLGHQGYALTTPHRLDALLRLADEPAFLERASSGLANWDADLSARAGAAPWQKGALLAAVALVAWAVATAPALTALAVSAVLFLLFAAAIAQRLAAVAVSPPSTAARPRGLPDGSLPVYTVIVPLFREARVLPQLVRNLDALDYPATKLDIKIMLEASDRDTIAAVGRLRLPARYDVVVLPKGHPQTKPRALNAALDVARGALTVVYDAEDRPDPGQLREAASRFAEAPPRLACLQARLAIDHADEAWITRLFAVEYAALFHVLLPGLAALGLPIPLGGTSNHFRTAELRRVGGWDSWNVTEDIDLGYRLARFGLAVGSLDSTTFEEAPLTVARWLPQRSRWLKGWMVTLVVHARRPVRFFRDFGARAGLSIAVSLGATVVSSLAGPPLLALVAIEAWRRVLFNAASPFWPLTVGASAALLAAGFVAVLWPAILGLKRLGRLDLAAWLPLLPLYFILISVAAARGLFEAWRDPQGWNKTEHGLARQRAGGPPSSRGSVRRTLAGRPRSGRPAR